MTFFLNTAEKILVNGDTGEVIRPSCYDDLSSYHFYLVGRGHHAAAQSLLRDVFKGEKVISKMIFNASKTRPLNR